MRHIIIILILCVFTISSCRTQRVTTDTIAKTDTVTFRHDSIIIHDRIVPVEVELPPSVQYVEVPINNDTVSVLSDRYYTSTASILKGVLRHSLKANPHAKITGQSIVHDTLWIQVDSTKINNSSQHSEIKEVPVNHLHWWQNALMWIGGLCLFGLALGVVLHKRLPW